MPDMSGLIVFFFFFQAEDGIRDLTVTGVQTCALPISYRMMISDQHHPGIYIVSAHHLIRMMYIRPRSEEHTSELQSQSNLVCRLLLEKKKALNHHVILGEHILASEYVAAGLVRKHVER